MAMGGLKGHPIPFFQGNTECLTLPISQVYSCHLVVLISLPHGRYSISTGWWASPSILGLESQVSQLLFGPQHQVCVALA